MEAFFILALMLFTSLCLLAGLYILFWLFPFNRSLQTKPNKNKTFPPVSIIICSRNAVVHLRKNLNSFLQQEYPEYEIIIVDDDSEDDTHAFITALQDTNPKLIYCRNLKTRDGKKQALEVGISMAKYSWIALSDVDCKPISENWLHQMMGNRKSEDSIVLGYAPYNKSKGILNAFIRFETLMNAIQYLTSAINGLAYMGTGRNLVYHKSIYDQSAIKPELIYGDDDLLINAKAKTKNNTICTVSESFVYSDAKASYRDYFLQRRRHYAASLYYNFISKTYLSLYFLSMAAFYFSLPVLLCYHYNTFACCLSGSYLVIAWPVFCKKANLLNEKDLCKYFPILNFLYFIHLLIQIPFLFIKKNSW